MFRAAVLNCIGNSSTRGQPRTTEPSAVTTSPVCRQVVGSLRTGGREIAFGRFPALARKLNADACEMKELIKAVAIIEYNK